PSPSPSPSPTSPIFQTDSPILPSRTSTPSPSLASQPSSYYRTLSYSNWSTDPTVIDGMATPQRFSTRLSDILPEDLDFYADERSERSEQMSIGVGEVHA
ncbi:hypothetical protein PtrEW7m1_012176, partial [Pyrenophora tritici-repentis]